MKKYIAVILCFVFAIAMLGFANTSAMENDVITVVEDVEETVFYDEEVASVEANAPVSNSLWMLRDGEYHVTFHDGRTATLAVNDGSWYYVSVAAPIV